MPTATLPRMFPFRWFYLDTSSNNYIPASGYVLSFFEPGGTTTPKAVYGENGTTSIGTSVTLNTEGYAFFRMIGKYYVTFKTAGGATVWTQDNVESLTESDADRWCGTATGTANAIILTPVLPVTSLVAGQRFTFKSGASANTGPVTFAISGLAAIAGQTNYGACVGQEILPNQLIEIVIDPSLTSCQITQMQPHYAAKTYANIISALGANPTDAGVQFFANNSAGTRKIFGSINVEIQNSNAGLEEGRMHFLVNDGNYLQPVGTINMDGAWILGPGVAAYTANIAGLQTNSGVPGDGAVFGERLAVVDPDYTDSRLLAIRNIAAFDLNSLDYKAGIGFSILNTATKERPVCTIRAQYVTRTAGIEDSKFNISLLKQGSQVEGPVFEHDKHSKGTAGGSVPGIRAIKPLVINKTGNYTLLREDSGAVITNSGAKSKLSFTLPDLDVVGVGWNAKIQTGVTPISLISGIKWIASTGDPGSYYLTTTSDTDPGYADPTTLNYYNNLFVKASVGTLANGQWGYGNVDTLGYNTIYVQPAEGDPDTAIPVPLFVTYPIRIISTTTNDGIYYTGASDDTSTIDSDGKLGSNVDFYSFNFMTNLKGWQGTLSGTWTRIP